MRLQLFNKLFLKKGFKLNLAFVETAKIDIPIRKFLIRRFVHEPRRHHSGYSFTLFHGLP